MADRETRAKTEGNWREVFAVFFHLGCTSFGGPVAHLGYFRDMFVERRRWFDDKAYADLVALAQFLPGPASSQVGLAIGLSRAGLPGAAAAFVAFTLPSALLLVAFAFVAATAGEALGGGWLNGLKIAAVAVVARALWGMAAQLCPDAKRATFAVAAAIFVTAVPGAFAQVGAIALAGLAGLALLREHAQGNGHSAFAVPVSRRLATACLVVFAALLVGLPLLAGATSDPTITRIDAFYRAGALVFGGGHVVLPLLEAQVVAPGWVGRDDFLAGYGAAQAIPGPLFTFAAYLGAVMDMPQGPWLGALICLLAIFLPSVLLVIGALPYWAVLRRRGSARSLLTGVNAGVVGLLAAAFYDPVWTSAIRTPADFALALLAFLLLSAWRVSPVIVVAVCALGGGLIAAL